MRKLLHLLGIHNWTYDGYYGYEVYRSCKLCPKFQRWSVRRERWEDNDYD